MGAGGFLKTMAMGSRTKVTKPMRFANRSLLAGGLGFAAAVLAGCGGSGTLLSPSQADSLRSQLAAVTAALDTGRCQQAQTLIQNFQNTADSYSSVDQTLISNLDQGASTISQLAGQRCHVTRTVSTSTATTTTPTTTTQTSTPTSPPTTSTPTTTTTTPGTTSTPTTTTPSTPTTTPTTGGTGLLGGGGPAGAHDNGAGNGGTPGNGGNGQ
jgi:hypothetical protein